VAANLVYEGLVEEALTIVKAVHDRHDGIRRNPWNEIECGNHYARSLSSWALLVAFSGFTFDIPKGEIGFEPAAGLRVKACGKEWVLP
jgi:non-lysosomal glucosylceramidase